MTVSPIMRQIYCYCAPPPSSSRNALSSPVVLPNTNTGRQEEEGGVFCLSSRWNKWVGYHLLAEQSGSTRTDRRPLLLASLLGEKLRQGRGVEKEGDFCTGPHHRLSHRKWRETKQQPSRLSDRARSGNQLLSFPPFPVGYPVRWPWSSLPMATCDDRVMATWKDVARAY